MAMATEVCVKCLTKQLNRDLITISRNANPKLFFTIFRHAVAMQLTVCRFCFGELMEENAELITVDDFIGDIPANWLQTDCKTINVKNEVAGEEERTEFVQANQPPAQQYIQIEQAAKNNGKTKRKTMRQHNESSKKRRKKPNQQINNPNLNADVSTVFIIDEDDDSNKCAEVKVLNNDKTVDLTDSEDIPAFSVNNDNCTLFLINEVQMPNPHENEDLEESHNYTSIDEELQESKADIELGPFQIQEDYNVTNMVAEIKHEVSGSCVDVVENETNTPTIEIDDSSSSNLDEQQMRLLVQFEKECDIIEQRTTASNMQENKAAPPQQLSEPEDHTSVENAENTLIVSTSDAVEVQNFSCSVCGQISDKDWKIQEHIAFGELNSACKNAQVEKYNLAHAVCCEYCCCMYRRPIYLQAHRASGIHADLTYTCPECTQCFKTFTALHNHIKQHSAPFLNLKPMYMCNVGNCEEICHDWPTLGKHKDRSHIAQICPNCRVTMHDSRFFAKHVRSCNTSCDQCVKKFDESTKRFLHERLCTRRDFQCDQCDAQYKKRSGLDDHIMFFHQPVDCALCGKVFKNQRSLSSHRPLCIKKLEKKAK